MHPLIERPVRVFLAGFTRLYGQLLFWRYLDGVQVRGLDAARAYAAQHPVILACNHTCWWDGILSVKLPHWLGVDGRFFVLSDNADSLAFVPVLGGIPLDRSSMANMVDAMEVASGWLTEPGRSLMLFPQGRFRAPGVRPLGLERGVGMLQRLSRAPIIPVSISMAYVDNHLPRCLITFGEPIEAGRRDVMDVLERRLVEGLDAHEAWIDDLSRPKTFAPLVRSGIVPIEMRPGSLLWRAGASLWHALKSRLQAAGSNRS